MKKIIVLSCLLLMTLFSVAFAQVDRSKAPEPGPAPKIQIGDYKSFELKNGLKVFVVENHKVPKVSIQLTLDRDPLLEEDKAGATQLIGELLSAGTTTRSKQELDEAVDFIGASLATTSKGVYGSALSKHKETLMELMSDVLLHPAFPEEELEKIRKQTLSALASQKDDPNAIAQNVQQVVNYSKSHPYGEVVTEETVQNVTVADAKEYYNTYMKPNKSYLVIVGDIQMREAKKLVKRYFGEWEEGEIPEHTYDTPQQPSKPQIAVVNKPGAVQSVIHVTYPVMLKPGEEDEIKARVMNTILGGTFSSRLMQNLREDKAYTYGARSNLSSDKYIGEFTAYAQVRTEVTDSAVAEFLKELNKIRDEEVSEEELQRTISQMTGSFARSLESPQTVANFALNIERYNLPKDYYATYLQKVSKVSRDDVQQMAQKYIKPEHANIVVVGNASEIAPKLEKFGEVSYYTIYGEKYTPKTGNIPKGMSADKVLASYFEAVGGKDKIEKVNDLMVVLEASFQGMAMNMEMKMKSSGKSATIVKVNGAEMQKEIYDGEKAVVVARGQVIPKDEKQTKEAAIRSTFWPELNYEEMDVQTKLVGVEDVNSKPAYVVEVTLPTGTTSTHYFDQESGYKVREASTVDTPQGPTLIEVDYMNYKEKDGIMFPYTYKMPLGPQKIEMSVVRIDVNKGISDETFGVQ